MAQQPRTLGNCLLLTVLMVSTGCGWFRANPESGRAIALPALSARMKGMTEAGYTPSVFNSPAVTNSIMHQDGVTWLAKIRMPRPPSFRVPRKPPPMPVSRG